MEKGKIKIELNGDTIRSKILTLLYAIPYCSVRSIGMLDERKKSIRIEKRKLVQKGYVKSSSRDKEKLVSIISTNKLKEEYNNLGLDMYAHNKKYRKEIVHNMKIRSEIVATVLRQEGNICCTKEQLTNIKPNDKVYLDIAFVRHCINNDETEVEENDKGISTVKGFYLNKDELFRIYEIKKRSCTFYWHYITEENILRKIRNAEVQLTAETTKMPETMRTAIPQIVVCMQSQDKEENFISRFCNYQADSYHINQGTSGTVNNLNRINEEITIIPWKENCSQDMFYYATDSAEYLRVKKELMSEQLNGVEFDEIGMSSSDATNHLIFMPIIKLKQLAKITKKIRNQILLNKPEKISITFITYPENLYYLTPTFIEMKKDLVKRIRKKGTQNYKLKIELRILCGL